ncbi:MAG: hypothetical protein K2X39_01175, partial [Silvanigrellaceae bacterium]|nr:hypothetical protein [Silvanigrellaceae bacterium]
SLLFAAMIAWIAAGPFLVMDTFHYGAVAFGLIQGLIFGTFIFGTRLVSQLIEKISMERITKLSISLAIFGGILSFALCEMTDYLAALVLPMMIFALGAGMGFPVFNRLSIEGSQEPMGIKIALFASFMGVSGLVGSGIVSFWYTGSLAGFAFFLFIFALCLIPLYGKYSN